MRDLSRFLDNPFDDHDISLAELLAFTTDYLQRAIANNPGGAFDARIPITTAALNLLLDAFSDELTKLGLREARVLAKENFRKTLPASLTKIAASYTAQFGPDSPQHLEAFPQGRSAVTGSHDDELQGHLQTLINASTANQAALGPGASLAATALKNGWLVVFNAKENAIGAKTASAEQRKEARRNLQLMLFIDLLTLGIIFPRQPEKLALFMNQSLLENPEPAPPEPPAPPPPPPGP